MKRITLCPSAFALLASAVFAAPTAAKAADITGVVSIAAGGQEPSRLVVFLDADPSLTAAPPPEGARPQIVQKGKAFVPDLLVVSQGTKVEFPNWDPFSHNVFSRSPAASFDLDRYGQGQSKSVTFNNVGLVQIFCNIHPQMKASLLVVPNRYFARGDSQGKFALRDVPPGRYVLIGWGLRAGEQRQTIVVPPEGLRDVAVALPVAAVHDTPAEPREPASRDQGVARGLGVKRERLNLPVVQDLHPAPTPQPTH